MTIIYGGGGGVLDASEFPMSLNVPCGMSNLWLDLCLIDISINMSLGSRLMSTLTNIHVAVSSLKVKDNNVCIA